MNIHERAEKIYEEHDGNLPMKCCYDDARKIRGQNIAGAIILGLTALFMLYLWFHPVAAGRVTPY